MEWWIVVLLFFGCLIGLMMTGLPVAFCFLMVNLGALYLLLPGSAGLTHMIRSIFGGLNAFTLVPLLLFTLMGTALFHTGVGNNMLTSVDKLIGRVPGRLGLVAVGAATVFSFLTGSAAGTTAMLGSTLTPEMEQRGYKRAMSLGPILGAGGLAIMIPPSGTAIILGAIGQISISGLLIGIIVPGFIMAGFYATYIIIRCWLQPNLAPSYEITQVPLKEKVGDACKYLLPVVFVVFAVIGVILLGIATPTEAAATGALAMFILAAAYKKLNWKTVKKSGFATVKVAVMILMIIGGARAFAEVLAFTGASRGIVSFVLSLAIPPIGVVIVISLVLLVLGAFMSPIPMMMFALPIFVPIIRELGFSTVWFGVLFILNAEIGMVTPPYGTGLFAMKGVAPPGTTMGEIYKASIPFCLLDIVVLVLLIAFPILVLWLPSFMAAG